jgi:hypothetical protein
VVSGDPGAFRTYYYLPLCCTFDRLPVLVLPGHSTLLSWERSTTQRTLFAGAQSHFHEPVKFLS